MSEDEKQSWNVVDSLKGKDVHEVVTELDKTRVELEVAIENLERDFNMGTIVRTANAFNVKKLHVIGRRQWNKRGAMKTVAYLHITYHASVEAFAQAMADDQRSIIAMDIVEGAEPLHAVDFPLKSVLVFGAEGPGISNELIEAADMVVMIEQFGSTRSINVGVAAGIAMYAWMQQHHL